MVCQLAETLGMFNLIVRVDLFLANNPLELKTFVQIYNLNDHVDFGDKIQYFIVGTLLKEFMNFMSLIKLKQTVYIKIYI